MPSPGQRALSLAVRIVEFPLLKLAWGLLLFAGATWLFGALFPDLGRMTNATIAGSFRRALLATLSLWATVRLFEGRTLGQAVGLSLRRAPADLSRGLLLAGALLSLAIGVLALAGDYRIEGLGDGASLSYLAEIGLLAVCVAVAEEVLARGMLLRFVEQALGTWAALAVSALLFGFAHLGNPGASVLSSVAIAVEGGLLFGAAYVAARSLWLPIGMHIAWNFFEGPLFGAPVSGHVVPSLVQAQIVGDPWLTGGRFGPEAGLPVFVLGTAAGVAAMVLAVRRGQILTPRWLSRLLRRMNRVPQPPAVSGPAPAS
ncbi:MAG TPA: CPBP family intramembrane glutamic endopeptidase [Myxococcaceae bacterium]|nr:CPBP family intramembrane glutamic endopeptidase [Myxococcaceae bacterium]